VQNAMLETALNDSERLRTLIQDFLTLSRLESNLMRWQLEAIALPETLDYVLSNFWSTRSPETTPQIRVDLPHPVPLLYTDGDGLLNVLTKLLDNACKFTQADGQVTISARPYPAESTSFKAATALEIIVQDTGRGIEPNQQEAIFERFYQAEGFMRRTAGGVGLGLAISRRIIERLGGMLWATSAGQNRGSAFHFTVPLVAASG
jgi:signal transduction histidine kinase